MPILSETLPRWPGCTASQMKSLIYFEPLAQNASLAWLHLWAQQLPASVLHCTKPKSLAILARRCARWLALGILNGTSRSPYSHSLGQAPLLLHVFGAARRDSFSTRLDFVMENAARWPPSECTLQFYFSDDMFKNTRTASLWLVMCVCVTYVVPRIVSPLCGNAVSRREQLDSYYSIVAFAPQLHAAFNCWAGNIYFVFWRSRNYRSHS